MFTTTQSKKCGYVSNIDMNNNVSDVGSNIDDSKKEELEEV